MSLATRQAKWIVVALSACWMWLPEAICQPETRLDSIRDVVTRNFSSVEDLRFSVDIQRFLEEDPSRWNFSTYVVAFRNDSTWYQATTGMYPPDTGVPPPWETFAFDGEVFRRIERGHGRVVDQQHTRMSRESESFKRVRTMSTFLSQSLRAWGFEINGHSLTEWLHSENAEIVSLEGTPEHIDIVEVHGFPDRENQQGSSVVHRFFLDSEKGFALTRFESHFAGELKFSVDVTEFSEIVPGVWFPTFGLVEPTGEVGGRSLQPSVFSVRDLVANSGIPDSFFVLEFDETLPIRDPDVERQERMQALSNRRTAREIAESIVDAGDIGADSVQDRSKTRVALIPSRAAEEIESNHTYISEPVTTNFLRALQIIGGVALFAYFIFLVHKRIQAR